MGQMRCWGAEHGSTSHIAQNDAVEAAMEEKYAPDDSQHPPDNFDLWEEVTGGKKKGHLVGLGTRRDPRLMVTSRTSSSSSSSHAHHTGSEPSEQKISETKHLSVLEQIG